MPELEERSVLCSSSMALELECEREYDPAVEALELVDEAPGAREFAALADGDADGMFVEGDPCESREPEELWLGPLPNGALEESDVLWPNESLLRPLLVEDPGGFVC